MDIRGQLAAMPAQTTEDQTVSGVSLFPFSITYTPQCQRKIIYRRTDLDERLVHGLSRDNRADLCFLSSAV
ncbi:hypothetical protein BaRGS_00019297 [Batillaria attramentaria]|uniref:Uncharacterized protein n=1 Tax=Batillaria attramentaria TaxID=370345 RepID=A0ABD0KRM3_9CAEN